MAKRLQVILGDSEYLEIQQMARLRHMSVAEWVREALGLTRRPEPPADIGRKLEIIRAAAQDAYPVPSDN